MPIKDDVRELKRRISPRLLGLRGISGVGISGGKLAVYLVEDSESVRQSVAAIIEAEVHGAEVNYIVSGPFRAQRSPAR